MWYDWTRIGFVLFGFVLLGKMFKITGAPRAEFKLEQSCLNFKSCLKSKLKCPNVPKGMPIRLNKPGTAQVGFISKAQKYSRNNNWKNLEKNKFFPKKVFGKKSRILPKNPKRDPLDLLNVFYKLTTSKKFKGVPFDRIQKFSEKCCIVPKKTAKVGPFGLPFTFGSIKKLVV